MRIYYCVTIVLNIVSIFVFHEYIHITEFSLIPLILIGLMVFQATIFNNGKVENGFRTAYGSNLSENEENQMMKIGSQFLYATIPWIIPFILFFSSFVKILSILIYFVGLLGGFVLYRCKHKSNIRNRIKAEENVRQEQEKKEQLGKWK